MPWSRHPGTTASFTLTRTGEPAEALTVPMSMTEGGAMASAALPIDATFAASSSSSLSVTTVDDAVAEASSTVTAAVAAGTGYADIGDAGGLEDVQEGDDVAVVRTRPGSPLLARTWEQSPARAPC